MGDFLFRKVSEKEKKEIQKQAKEVMDNFSQKLAKIDKNVQEPLIERDECERVEGQKEGRDFSKEIMFENAVNKNKDFIVAEKKKW